MILDIFFYLNLCFLFELFFLNLFFLIIFVLECTTDEQIENNAKYAISIARKLGATVFLIWEDIKDVKQKMIMTFVAALMEVHNLTDQMKKEKNKVKDLAHDLDS